MNPPMQPRTMYAPTGATGTAFEEEHSLAREIFLGSTTITLGTGQQELSGHAAQEPSGHGEPEDAVAVSTVNTEGTEGDGAPCPGEALAIPPMANHATATATTFTDEDDELSLMK